MGGGSTTTSTQEVELSPEAQQLMADELALFTKAFLPAEMSARGDALQGLGPAFASTAGAKGTEKALDVAKLATTKAGGQGNLSAPSLTAALAPQETAKPEAMGGMQNIFRQMAMQKNSLMDPRFASFMRPDVNQSTEGGGPTAGQQAMQAASLAVAVAGTVASLIAI